MNIRQRAYDPVTGNYLSTPGDAYTIERLMPVPYKLGLKLDIWTSNTEQKLQLVEQLAQLFNPGLDIQSTDNYVDWGSLTHVELKSTVWDSRSVPASTDESISIATLQFEMPIWLSSPAKVKRLGVITNIVNNVYDANGEITDNIFAESDIMVRQVIVLRNYSLLYIGNTLRLIKQQQRSTYEIDQGQIYDAWSIVRAKYGAIRNGISEIRLRHPNGISEVVGTIAEHPTDDSVILFNPHIDTLPANTLAAVNAIIDPASVKLDQYAILTPDIGTRYIILNSIGHVGDVTEAWGDLVARANDIVEYTSNGWVVHFDSQQSGNFEFVTNLTSSVQYKWDYQANEWSKSVEGLYDPGNWSLVV
jgi:hypothetical protein